MALRFISEGYGGVELDEFMVSGKPRIMVLGIDRNRLLKELAEIAQLKQAQQLQTETSTADVTNQSQSMTMQRVDENSALGALMPRPLYNVDGTWR